MAAPDGIDPAALARELRRNVGGEVRFDDGGRALYATDASNYRQVPLGVVLPRDADDVIATVAICRRHGAPVLPRGGGTSLAGQCCNVAVVLDTSRHMNRILELDPKRRIARVEPGVVLDRLRDAAERHRLTFGPDPSTHNHCTLGGMIGNNSCGLHSVMAGKTDENVESLDVLTYDGLRLRVGATSDVELARLASAGGRAGAIYAGLHALRDRYADRIRAVFPHIARRVSGYNLIHLLPERGFHVARALVGSEGTCVSVLEATVRLVPSPPARALLVLGFPDVYDAAARVPDVLETGPIALEGMDDRLVEDMKKTGIHPRDVALLPDGGGWLLAEYGGDTAADAAAQAHEALDAFGRWPTPPTSRLVEDRAEQHRIWIVRESGLGATAHVPNAKVTWEGWEDSAVPIDRLSSYLRDLRALFDRYGYACALYGHFGQGCVHTRIDFDLVTAPGIRTFRAFLFDAADLVVRYGGSFSGEHGDGQSRAELLPKMFGPELVRAFEEFKDLWDPDGRMNPGKVVRPYRTDQNLRLGTSYRPDEPATHFRFPDDRGSFRYASIRCVGVGECRREHGGTMCPSYRVTGEEQHSTRGRARLLFEMLQGDVVRDGWRSRAVREALDLCLACKGCKSDCPVNVDMATYKAEFLSHHYARRLRPRAAYAMGLIYWWARLASHAPRLVNATARAPGLGRALKWIGGIAPSREMPRFATTTFRRWFAGRRPATDGRRGAVLLWPDTFTNFLEPEIAIAAVRVLEAAGYRVRIPSRVLCCGRPLYDFGMLDLARRQLRQVMDALRPVLASGIPVVGLEPSCVAVFRDELRGLFPEDPDATRLEMQTVTIAELLDRARDLPLPHRSGRALYHGHCHEKAVLDAAAERRVLERLGLAVDAPDTGCCGMAGSFGFERGKADVSIACGERVLLPAVRAVGPDGLVVASGFSCRTQIVQTVGHRARHLVEVIDEALAADARREAEPPPRLRAVPRAARMGESGS